MRGRATVLGDQMRRQWQIDGQLADLPISPQWIINATCYQTGKNWRFQRDMMGDYQTKYVTCPSFDLSHALAASAAVPGLIGPLIVKSGQHRWSELRSGDWHAISPKYSRLHLWDGGVYDNLGVESLFKPGEGLCEGTDFLIVSDASRPLSADSGRTNWRPGYLDASKRLVDVATDQVRSLRARMLIDFFRQNPGSGTYVRLGRKTKHSDVGSELGGREFGRQTVLTDRQVTQAAEMETTLRRLTHAEFSVLFRHGYEVADATLTKHCGEVMRRTAKRTVHFRAA